MNALLSFFALCGHLGLWVACSNRMGATGWNYQLARWLRRSVALIIAGLPLLVALNWRNQLLDRDWWMAHWPHHVLTTCYAAVCWLWFCWIVLCWCRRRLQLDGRFHALNVSSQQILLSEQTEQPLTHGSITNRLSKLPGNQVLSLEVNRKQLALPACPLSLSGLTITHLSDVHISNRFTPAFYRQLVCNVNQLQSDLIAITGDLADMDPVPNWVIELYGQLIARLGVFFVLGNHDYRKRQLLTFRQSLVEQGMIYLGRQPAAREIEGVSVDFFGNEYPWSETGPATRQDPASSAFSIALAHSPDQFRWAQQQQMDLLLAGHMHGGQICFPGIGPVVGPSRYGVTYSEGCFQSGPTTMHVSRGAGGLAPLRWNCRPEITQLEIRSAT